MDGIHDCPVGIKSILLECSIDSLTDLITRLVQDDGKTMHLSAWYCILPGRQEDLTQRLFSFMLDARMCAVAATIST